LGANKRFMLAKMRKMLESIDKGRLRIKVQRLRES
jgi:hypothetical protein